MNSTTALIQVFSNALLIIYADFETLESEEKAQEALEEVKKIEAEAEKVQDEIEEVQEKLEEVAEKIDEVMDENDDATDELEEVDNPRQKAAKDKIVADGAAKEEELLKHEDALYDG